jgi:VanZ family protein
LALVTKPHLQPWRYRKLALVTCIATWIGAFAATHVPADELPSFQTTDKTLHLIGYAGLSTAFWLTLRAYGQARLRRALLVVLVLAGYGALDEATQPLVNRYASVVDWQFNCIGALLAAAFWETVARLIELIRRSRPQRSRPL